MTWEFWENAAKLPTIARAVEETVDTLSEGRSVLALLPKGLPVEKVQSWIESEILQRRIGYDVLSTTANSAVPVDPAQLAGMYLALELGGGKPYLDIVRHGDFPEILCVLVGDHLSEDERLQWVARVLPAWASQAKAVTSEGLRRALLIVEQADRIMENVPQSDANLAVQWWWGLMSEVEVRILARLNRDTDSMAANDGEDMWRECLMAAIAPGDLGLAVALQADTPQSLDGLDSWLIAFEGQAGFDADEALPINLMTSASPIPFSPPPRLLRKWWGRGLIVASLEHGFEIHPATAAATGDFETIRYRMWRTQTASVFPLVNLIRLEVCKDLVQAYGSHWFRNFPTSPTADEDMVARDMLRLENDPKSAGLGYLAFLCRQNPTHSVVLSSWREVLTLAHKARTEIAHYRPVDRAVISRLWRAWTRKMGSA